MLRRMLRVLFVVAACAAACTPLREGDAFFDAGSPAGMADRNARPVSTLTPAVLSVSPDHGSSGEVITITGSGFGLDPSAIRVRVGGTPVEVTSLHETEEGYQRIEVELNAGTVSGPISVYAADSWTTFSNSFCAQPVIHHLTLARAGERLIVRISGSNIDPLAAVHVGDAQQEPQRLKLARRPYRIDATQLFVTVQPGDQGTVRVENRCADGRRFVVTSTATFWR